MIVINYAFARSLYVTQLYVIVSVVSDTTTSVVTADADMISELVVFFLKISLSFVFSYHTSPSFGEVGATHGRILNDAAAVMPAPISTRAVGSVTCPNPTRQGAPVELPSQFTLVASRR